MPQIYEPQEDQTDIITEGKTKIVRRVINDPTKVRIQSKDDITKGDGASRTSWEGKGCQANATTCNIFRFLNHMNIPTHFIEQIDERNFLAKRVVMYPLEVVARRVATGSVLKRNPDMAEGYVFDNLMLEIFFKGKKDDPYVSYDPKTKWYNMYDADKPISQETYRGEVPWTVPMPTIEELNVIFKYQRMIFEALEYEWALEETVLVDLKCEYGMTLHGDGFNGRKLVVADEITGDSCRLWPFGNKSLARDKDPYRRHKGEVTEEDKKEFSGNYRWIEDATSRFPGNEAATSD